MGFIGHIPESELVKQYNRSELFVLPSTSPAQEGFGIVLLEAMACGLPVVTTDIAGVSEEIEKRYAEAVIRPANTAELARAITMFFQNERLIRKSGRVARELAEKYGWGRVAKNVSMVYSSLFC